MKNLFRRHSRSTEKERKSTAHGGASAGSGSAASGGTGSVSAPAPGDSPTPDSSSVQSSTDGGWRRGGQRRETPTLHRLFGASKAPLAHSRSSSFGSTFFGKRRSAPVPRTKSVHFEAEVAPATDAAAPNDRSAERDSQVSGSPELGSASLFELKSPELVAPTDTHVYLARIYAKLCVIAQVVPDERISSNVVYLRTAIELLLDGFGARFESDRDNLLQLRKDVSAYVISKEDGYEGGEIHHRVQETEDLIASVRELVQERITQNEPGNADSPGDSSQGKLAELQRAWDEEKQSLTHSLRGLEQENSQLRQAANTRGSKEEAQWQEAVSELARQNTELQRQLAESKAKLDKSLRKTASLRSEVKSLEQMVVQIEVALETKEAVEKTRSMENIRLQLSNSLAVGDLHKLIHVTVDVLHPLLSDEASDQIGESLASFSHNSVLDDSTQQQFSVLYSFLVTAMRELVSQFRKNEHLLEGELQDRATCHQQVLDSYTKILQSVLKTQQLSPRVATRRKRHAVV